MLACWNGEPHNRPTFTDLRSKFDAMLVAERKDAYIDLRIDNDKPYYRLDTMTTLVVNDAHSPNQSRCSLLPTKGSVFSSRSGSKECSPKPPQTLNFSSSQLSRDECSSAHTSVGKSGEATGPSMISLSSLNLSPHHYTCEQNRRASDADRRGRHHEHNQGRPVSMLLPGDRERREKQNPYVEEPSRGAATTLAPPKNDSGCHVTLSGSDGAIELRQNYEVESASAGIEITVTSDETKVRVLTDSVM